MTNSARDALVRELVALEHRLQQAVQQHDRSTLEDLISPNFRLITSRSGNPVRRDDWIAAAAGEFEVASFSLRDFVVNADGDTAVISRRDTQDATLAGEKAHDEWFTSDTWVRRSGRWQLLARHAEPVDESRRGDSAAAAVVRRYAEEVLGTWDLERASGIVAETVVAHEPSGDFRGIAAWRRRMDGWATTFPERHVSTDDLFAAGDRVCWRWRLDGVHVSGRRVTVRGTIVFSVREGRIVEYWGVHDRLGTDDESGGITAVGDTRPR